MFKKIILLAAVFLLSSFGAQARAGDDITMLIIPRDVIPLQIGQDISRRYPVLLVSYQTVRGGIKIHAWNGDNWVFVPASDYTNGTFFANRPKHAVLIENPGSRAPDVLIPNSIWCEKASRLTSTDPRVMLRLLGLHFNFPYRYWDFFAKRYGYLFEEINPALVNVRWWNFHPVLPQGTLLKANPAGDLSKWRQLDLLPPPAVAPVVTEQKAPELPAPPSANTVEITAKAAEIPVVAPPVIAPAPVKVPAPVVTPAPVVAPTPVTPAPAVEPIPFIEPAPIIEPAPVPEKIPSLKPEPVIEPVWRTEPVPAPPVEMPTTAEVPPVPTAPATASTADAADLFAAQEIPAAEIVVPQTPKKPWWKIF
jgi:hypothetical protein